VLKGILRKKMDSDILTPQKLALKFPLQPRPMKLTVSQCKLRAWVFEWVVTSTQELPNLTSSGNCCFSSDEEFSSTKSKQTEVGETMRSLSKQSKSIKPEDVPEVTSFGINLPFNTRSTSGGKFKS